MTPSGRPERVLKPFLTRAALVFAVATGCSSPDAAGSGAQPASERAAPVPADPPPPADPDAAWQRAAAAVEAWADSADRLLRTVPNLTAQERTRLRRDVNEIQIERARQLGVPRDADVQRMVAAGRLVRLEEDTRYWVVRELDFSEPYVVPSAHAMLLEIGERFHARLDSIGAPRFRLDITSVLRTPELQAELRRRNRNASRVESSHEFGTTVDIAYRRFAPPAWAPSPAVHPALEPQARQLADTTFLETGRLRGAELQAVLGRVLQDMQSDGKLLVIMERSQTVYHVTVGTPYPNARPGASSERPAGGE